MNYDDWITCVDGKIAEETGLTHEDLPDFLWADMYEEGLAPAEAWEVYLEENPHVGC